MTEKTSEEDLNKFNRLLLDKINENGNVFLTHTSLSGRFTIRMAIGQRTTEMTDVLRAWEIIRNAANHAS
jgi:hypothetical protein